MNSVDNGGKKRNIIKLGDVLLDADTVSAILKDDNDVNHLGKSSVSIHFFNVIADGQNVKIVGKSREDRDSLRAKLIERLGWNNE